MTRTQRAAGRVRTARRQAYPVLRQIYLQHLERAGYYRWSARRPELPQGREPLNGASWHDLPALGEEIARAQHIAAARVCLAWAKLARRQFGGRIRPLALADYGQRSHIVDRPLQPAQPAGAPR